MRLTVLVDNQAARNLSAEWGLSFFIEVDNRRILFDMGASELFLANAARLNINLLELDYLVLSHGHNVSPVQLHPCHCTDLDSKFALGQVSLIREVSTGLQLNYQSGD